MRDVEASFLNFSLFFSLSPGPHPEVGSLGMKKAVLIVAGLTLLAGCSPNAEEPTPAVTHETTAIESEVTTSSPEESANQAEKYVIEPLSEPWPSEINRDRLIGAALFEAFNYFDAARVDQCPVDHHVYMAEKFHPDHVELAKGFTRDVVNLFCGELHKEIYVIGGDHDYVLSTIAANDLPSDPHGGVCGVPVGEDFSADWFVACAYRGDIAWIGQTLGTVRFGELKTDEWKVATSIHEIVHLVQDQQFDSGEQGTPARPHPRFKPVWLIEGGAEFLADSAAEYLSIQEYQWTTPTDRSGGRIGLDVSSDLRVFETWASPSLGPVDYYVGQVASEYLVASVGFDAYMDIFRRMEANEGDFDQSFEEAIGISLEDFYAKFEVMHLNLYDKKVIINE